MYCRYLLPFCRLLFHSKVASFNEEKLLTLKYLINSSFPLGLCFLLSSLRNLCLFQGNEKSLLCYLFRSFTVLPFIGRSTVRLKFIFVCMVWKGVKISFFHMGIHWLSIIVKKKGLRCCAVLPLSYVSIALHFVPVFILAPVLHSLNRLMVSLHYMVV